MDELEPIDVGRSLALVWGKLMMQKRHDNALLTGVLAYLVSREAKDSELKAGALSWVEKTLQELRETEEAKPEEQVEAAPSCSFCAAASGG